MSDRSRLGIVSNCWQHQLSHGEDLADLVAHAADELGLRYIELRQGSLGNYEDASRQPDPEALGTLPARFPHVRFNLAVELPFFSRPIPASDSARHRYLDAAAVLGGHLRVVDLQALQPDPSSDPPHATAVSNLTALAAELSDGQLSVEHAVQPWTHFERAFRQTRAAASNVRVCFDPANLWASGDGERALEITSSIPVSEVSMVHLKQRRGERVLPSYASGDVDWLPLLQSLTDRQYAGPFLFEIAPGPQFREELFRGIHHLDRMLADSSPFRTRDPC